jgi:TonB family protein
MMGQGLLPIGDFYERIALNEPSTSPLCTPSDPRHGGRVVECEGITDIGEASLVRKKRHGFRDETRALGTDALPRTIPDLALALVFDEIVHQACSMNARVSAAVVRIQDGIPISRTAFAASTSDVSAYLTQRSASSWKAGRPQLCQDVELDSRFDKAAFRRLRVRSFMVMPVRDKDKAVIAMVQAFSSRPQAFRHDDLLLMKSLAGRVAKHVAVVEQTPAFQTAASRPNEPVIPPQKIADSRRSRLSSRNRPLPGMVWNLLLGCLTIVVAILLGWALGRTEQQNIQQNSVARMRQAEAASEFPTVGPDTVSNHPVTNVPVANSSDFNPESEKVNGAIHKTHSTSSKSGSKRSEEPVDDVVVFENGKQIFPGESSQSKTSGGDPSDSSKRSPELPTSEPAVRVPEQVAEEHLLDRIEPEYPERAREQRLQGTVILDVSVDKRGSVSSLSRVSGDTQLTLLAAKAVRQWKFAPLVRDGAPVSFESRITLDFALP